MTADTPTDPVGPRDLRRDESMGELVKSLSNDLSLLMRQEIALAQTEMTEKGRAAGVGLGLFGAAGLIAYVGLGALALTLIALLATAVKLWVAALIITVAYFVVAGLLGLVGRGRFAKAAPPVPEQTTETLKEDAQWAKTQLRSDSK